MMIGFGIPLSFVTLAFLFSTSISLVFSFYLSSVREGCCLFILVILENLKLKFMSTIRLGDIAQISCRNYSGTIQFHEWLGDSWVLFHIHLILPVCTTELGVLANCTGYSKGILKSSL
jgi:hypothetical protein